MANNPISDKSTIALGAEFVANGLLEIAPDGKPRPTLKGILFAQVLLQGWTLFDLFAIAAEHLKTGIHEVQTDDAMQRIMREFARGMAVQAAGGTPEEPGGTAA